MSNFGKMAIPVEADGITDDQKAFKNQQRNNAKALEQEIKDSHKGGLAIGDFEDINNSKKHECSEAAIRLIQARKIGRHTILLGSH